MTHTHLVISPMTDPFSVLLWCSMDPITGLYGVHQIPAHPVSPLPRGCHEGWQASLQLLPGYWGYPLVMTNYWKWPVIVDFPINSMVIFHSHVKLPEGTYFGRLRAPPSFEVHQKKNRDPNTVFFGRVLSNVFLSTGNMKPHRRKPHQRCSITLPFQESRMGLTRVELSCSDGTRLHFVSSFRYPPVI